MQARNALGAIAGIMLTAGVLAAQATPAKKEQAKPMTPAATAAKPAIPATPATPAASAKSADTTKHVAAKKHRKAKPRAKQD